MTWKGLMLSLTLLYCGSNSSYITVWPLHELSYLQYVYTYWCRMYAAQNLCHNVKCIMFIGESVTAVQHVLRCMGYDASDSKSISDTFLLEMHPDEVQWIKASPL